MRERPYFEIFVVSFAAILLEIAFTRIFSFKVYYYFTYLIIGLGLLGLGAGGILVAISRPVREADPARLIPIACFAGSASIFVAYYVVAGVQLNASTLTAEFYEKLKVLFVSITMTLPFLAVGTVVSTILANHPDRADRLYGTDLLGAALGCTLAIPFLYLMDPPRTVILAGGALAVGGLRLAAKSKTFLSVGAVLVGVSALILPQPKFLPDPVVDAAKGYEDYRDHDLIRFTEWSPVFRVDVADHPVERGDTFLLHHDGQPGSGMRRWDAELTAFKHLPNDSRKLPFEVLPPNPRVLIIGSAGGHEVVASLYYGASEVTGVELNPVTLSLLTDHYADLSGNLADNPKVRLINGDGRWFLKQSDEEWDLIWFVAPDSYAAMNASTSGAFVLAESYLYTVEMLVQSLEHLTPHGIVCAQFGELDYTNKPNRTTRYLSTVRQSFTDLRIPDFKDNVLMAGATGYPPFQESAVLIGRSAFQPDQVERFTRHTLDSVPGGKVLYAPGMQNDQSSPHQAILLPFDALDPWFRGHPYQIEPVFDDSPFFWHFTRFGDAVSKPIDARGGIVDYEDAVGEAMMVVLLALVIILGATFLLAPFFAIRETWLAMPHKGRTIVYFASLGLGFMFIEVALIQMLTLFLGYPTYSLSVTLFGVLVFSGIGSILSSRYSKQRNKAMGLLFCALLALVGLYHNVLPALVDHFVGHPLPLRIAMTIVVIAPVGLVLGAFMPIGVRTVAGLGDHPREYVAWAWAINAFFSVVASILSTMLAMMVGFKFVLMLAVLIYLAGVVAMIRLPEPEPAT